MCMYYGVGHLSSTTKHCTYKLIHVEQFSFGYQKIVVLHYYATQLPEKNMCHFFHPIG